MKTMKHDVELITEYTKWLYTDFRLQLTRVNKAALNYEDKYIDGMCESIEDILYLSAQQFMGNKLEKAIENDNI